MSTGKILSNIATPSSLFLIATLVSGIQGLYMYHRCGNKRNDEVWLGLIVAASLAMVAATATTESLGKNMSEPEGILTLSILYLATSAVTNKLGNRCNVSQMTAQWMSSNTTVAVCGVLFAIYQLNK